MTKQRNAFLVKPNSTFDIRHRRLLRWSILPLNIYGMAADF